MNNPQNAAIVLLLVSAAILTGVLVSTFTGTGRDAAAAGSSVREGDYTMTTAAWRDDTDLLYILDIAARQINVYVYNRTTNAIELRDSASLK
jgi:predicted small secreted protein